MQHANKREKQRLERKKQIMMCALDMIIARGFEAMKIRDIADALGISTGLFFNYFASKEEVYEELVKIGLSGPARVFELNVEEIEPIALFERMTETIFEALKESSLTGKMFVLMAQTMRQEAVPEGVKSLMAGFNPSAPLLEKVRAGQRAGSIKAGDPQALLMAYWGAVQGIAESYALGCDQPLPESGWIVDIVRA